MFPTGLDSSVTAPAKVQIYYRNVVRRVRICINRYLYWAAYLLSKSLSAELHARQKYGKTKLVWNIMCPDVFPTCLLLRGRRRIQFLGMLCVAYIYAYIYVYIRIYTSIFIPVLMGGGFSFVVESDS